MAARIIAAIIAISLFVGSFYIYEHKGILHAIFAVFVGFIFIFPLLSHVISSAFANIFIMEGNMKVKEEFSLVKGLIANAQYDEAIQSLDDYLIKNPKSVAAKSLLAKIYYEQKKQPNKVLELFFEDLKLPKLSVDYEDLIQMSIDILIEQNRKDDAQKMIHQCIPKITNGMLKKKLVQRLKYL